MSNRIEDRGDGPLAVHIAGFGEVLAEQGYAAKSAAQQQLLMAHASGWLADHNLGVADFTEMVMAEFLAGRRAAGYSAHVSMRGMSPMIDYLRSVGAAPAVVVVRPTTTADLLIERYVGYLVRERGLASSTVVAYARAARSFFAGRLVGGSFDLGSLSASDVTSYVLAECQRGATSSTRATTSPLRSLLRFLFVEGLIDRDLIGAVPSGPDRRMTSLPKAIRTSEVARLLSSCDRETMAGLRDFAIITVLSRLGLRAAETAALLLSDIDWRRGELVVRGKANRAARLPLPVDVGEAVVGWLERLRASWRPPSRLHPATGAGWPAIECRRVNGREPSLPTGRTARHACPSSPSHRGHRDPARWWQPPRGGAAAAPQRRRHDDDLRPS